ncbi:MAG: PmbA/TldA family metallopeptidase, partial [Acidimicrobiia bacterium]
MVDESVLQRVLSAALGGGGEFAEVYVEDRRTSGARLDDGKIEEFTAGRARGAGIRVVSGTSTGYA